MTRFLHLALFTFSLHLLCVRPSSCAAVEALLLSRAGPSSSTKSLRRSGSAPSLSGAGPSRSGSHAQTGVNEKILILARHGNTHATEERLVQGHTDDEKTKLSAAGHRDVQKLANNIQKSGYKVHEIVSCHQKRTCESAAPILKAYPQASHHTDTRLMGVGMGRAEGKPYEEFGLGVRRKWDWRKAIPDAEPTRTYKNRIDSVYEDVISRPAHQFSGSQTKGVRGRRHLHDRVAEGETHTTAVVGHDWPTRRFLRKVGKKLGVTRFSDTDPASHYGSGGVSVVKVKNIREMPRRPNGSVDLKRASGDHFEIHHVANKADQSIKLQTNPKFRLSLH